MPPTFNYVPCYISEFNNGYNFLSGIWDSAKAKVFEKEQVSIYFGREQAIGGERRATGFFSLTAGQSLLFVPGKMLDRDSYSSSKHDYLFLEEGAIVQRNIKAWKLSDPIPRVTSVVSITQAEIVEKTLFCIDAQHKLSAYNIDSWEHLFTSEIDCRNKKLVSQQSHIFLAAIGLCNETVTVKSLMGQENKLGVTNMYSDS